MSEKRMAMPDQLRAAIAADLRPVKPLASPWKRLLYAAPVAATALAMPLVYFKIRDTGELGVMLAWVPVAVQVLLAAGLLMFALREGIPGWQASTRSVFLLCTGAYALQIAVNLAIFVHTPIPSDDPTVVSMWMSCFRVEALIGLPILVLVAWLVARALPSRPWVAGFLAGTGAGFAGDASWRLICPYSTPGHVMLGHTGGILVLGLTGFLLGYLWSLYSRGGDAEARS